ncbi:MAG: hypothetical protein AAFX05_12850 [Planctomycetota bacterium]
MRQLLLDLVTLFTDARHPLFWIVSIGLGVLALLSLRYAIRGDRSRRGTRCPKCGYDITKTEGPRCPECGLDRIADGRTFRRHSRLRRGLTFVVLSLALASLLTLRVVRLNGYDWTAALSNTVLVVVMDFGWHSPVHTRLGHRVYWAGGPSAALWAWQQGILEWRFWRTAEGPSRDRDDLVYSYATFIEPSARGDAWVADLAAGGSATSIMVMNNWPAARLAPHARSILDGVDESTEGEVLFTVLPLIKRHPDLFAASASSLEAAARRSARQQSFEALRTLTAYIGADAATVRSIYESYGELSDLDRCRVFFAIEVSINPLPEVIIADAHTALQSDHELLPIAAAQLLLEQGRHRDASLDVLRMRAETNSFAQAALDRLGLPLEPDAPTQPPTQ